MRIGIDCRLWSETGVGRYIRNLVENLLLLDRTNDYVLFVRSVECENIKRQVSKTENKWKVVPVDFRWHTITEQIRFPSILNSQQLDLIHFPYFSVPLFYNKPFIITIHDLILHHHPSGEASTLPQPLYVTKLLAYKFIINQAAHKAQKIITVSHATKKEIVDHLGISDNKIAVVYEGVEEKFLRESPNTTDRQNAKYFLYVGNAYPHKNLNYLLIAFKEFSKCYPEVRLVLVGKNDFFYNKIRRRVNDLHIASSVQFLGDATDDELKILYKNAIALVMPSFMEGFGLPVLEAMANSCLVIASDIPVFRELFGDVPIYFNPFNTSDMTQKMTQCFNDLNHFSKRRLEGLNRAKIFSWEKMSKQTLKIYNSVL